MHLEQLKLRLNQDVNVNNNYSIVKDSSADLGVNSKIVQIRPTGKAVSTKISKLFFAYLSIFGYY